ncbi:chemotaxis protein CheA [Rhizobium sp. G21]|uniref:chemotaxis protein CheA n=1 Tax=Rhizobium sp. G21 TaxID=2758439 RepID=UPI001AED7A30|nr:Hpt domain-containing protein [Rhizobium sp. G21]
MSPLLEQFLIEARDFLEQIGDKLLLLEERPGNEVLIGEIFRAVHTLKGNSGLFDMPILTSVVHAAEDLLDRVRDHSLEMDPELTDALLDAMDFVSNLLNDVGDDGTIPQRYLQPSSEIAASLRRLLPKRDDIDVDAHLEEPEAMPPPSDWTWLARIADDERASAFDAFGGVDLSIAVRYRPEPDCFFKGEDPLLLIRNSPGMVLFDVIAPDPWPDADALDVYRCNLQFDLVSSADREAIEHHFRYVPDQIAIYDMPVFALALPAGGEELEQNSMIGPIFIEEARERLAADDLAGLRAAVDAALDMINPVLRAASGLRWLQRLLDAGVPRDTISYLVDALAADELPDWKSLPEMAAAAEKPDVEDQADDVVRPQTPPLPSLDSDDLEAWNDLVGAQASMLSCSAHASERPGRVLSARNVLASLLTVAGRVDVMERLDDATRRAQQSGEVEPLLAFIEDIRTGDTIVRERAAAPTLAPALETMEGVLPAQEKLRATPERALETAMSGATAPQALPGPDVGEAGRRTTEPGGGDRGVRVLKVPQEKVDRLMELIGEMVVAKNALPYLAARAEDHFGSRELSRELKSQYAIINRIAEEMQDGIMQVRMLPVGAVFQRFPRLVRDVARQLGKVVKLVVEGEETEADKNIVESLSDPMIHILRNSLDHGLETPEVRRANSKAEEGRLTVRASQEDDRVLIEIEDDGKGIDPDVVKRKAFEKGLIDEARLETLTDAEAVQLVFAAGFSTADQISNLSGRGVGMDVVKSSLEKSAAR